MGGRPIFAGPSEIGRKRGQVHFSGEERGQVHFQVREETGVRAHFPLSCSAKALRRRNCACEWPCDCSDSGVHVEPGGGVPREGRRVPGSVARVRNSTCRAAESITRAQRSNRRVLNSITPAPDSDRRVPGSIARAQDSARRVPDSTLRVPGSDHRVQNSVARAFCSACEDQTSVSVDNSPAMWRVEPCRADDPVPHRITTGSALRPRSGSTPLQYPSP